MNASNDSYSHSLGAVVGTLGGVLAGTAVGWAWGPVGVVVAALVGALGGGVAGYGFGEAAEPYGVAAARDCDERIVRRHSWDQYVHYKGRAFDDVTPDIGGEWDELAPASRDGR
jgi:phage tail tape-measure protein